MTTPAASTYGAVKAFVEAQGLSLSVYKDVAPTTTKDPTTGRLMKPFCTFLEDIGMGHDSDEDGGSAQGGTSYVTELAQLDLWMNWRDEKDQRLEDLSLPAVLHRKLAGATLDLAPTRVYNVRVQNRIRLVERDNNLVHTVYTLAIRRAV